MQNYIMNEADFRRYLEDMKKLGQIKGVMVPENILFEKYLFSASREIIHREERQASKPPPLLWHDEKSRITLAYLSIVEKQLKLLKTLDTLQACFEDPIERHVQYFRFKEDLEELRDTVDSEYWDLARLAIGCIDAVSNTDSDDLTLSQIEAFRKVVKEIDDNVGCSKANSLLSILISAGLKPVPPLKNLELLDE